jgi:hypothetical protein
VAGEGKNDASKLFAEEHGIATTFSGPQFDQELGHR